jgi:hypothetical protein
LIDASANPNYPLRSEIIVELNRHIDRKLWDNAAAFILPQRPNNRQLVSLKELAEIYAKESGIPVILEFEPGKDEAKRQPLALPNKNTEGYPWDYAPSNVSLLLGMRAIPSIISNDTLPENFTFIFDNGRIKILSVDRAVDWWRTTILTKD